MQRQLQSCSRSAMPIYCMMWCCFFISCFYYVVDRMFSQANENFHIKLASVRARTTQVTEDLTHYPVAGSDQGCICQVKSTVTKFAKILIKLSITGLSFYLKPTKFEMGWSSFVQLNKSFFGLCREAGSNPILYLPFRKSVHGSFVYKIASNFIQPILLTSSFTLLSFIAI